MEAQTIGKPERSGSVTIVRDVRRVPGHRRSDAVTDPVVAAKLVRAFQESGELPTEREAFVVLLLDTRHRLLGLHVASIGTLSGSMVHPREVFRPAIALGAAAVVVAHNHPSGNPLPSIEDRQVTEQLRNVGEMVGIPLLDHVVVGDRSCFSLADSKTFALPEVRRGS